MSYIKVAIAKANLPMSAYSIILSKYKTPEATKLVIMMLLFNPACLYSISINITFMFLCVSHAFGANIKCVS